MRFAKGGARGHLRSKPTLVGALVLTFTLVALFAVYQKERIATVLSSGGEVTAEFKRDYGLRPNESDVKMAGVVVGTVTDVEKADNGVTIVSAKVNEEALSKLGSAPSASIRPTTLLGGRYFLSLSQGRPDQEYDGQTIPDSRTSVPVELDRILGAIPKDARESIQDATRLADKALKQGADDALGRVLDAAPGTLRPATDVLQGAMGTRPGKDLWRLVPHLNAAAATLAEKHGQLGRVIDSLDKVSAAVYSSRNSLASTLHSLPRTLSETRSGLGKLQGSLDRLERTAAEARPAIQELGPLLTKADPVIQRALPVVRELRPVLHDALPLVRQLVPTAQNATETLANIKGPVLQRINGPITDMVLSPWHGSGAYKNNGSDHLFYQELGYLAAHTANLSKYRNKNGAMIGLALGVGVSSVGGNNIGTAKILQSLGLLPGGGVSVLSPHKNPGQKWKPMQPSAPGQDSVLSGPLGPLIPEQNGQRDPETSSSKSPVKPIPAQNEKGAGQKDGTTDEPGVLNEVLPDLLGGSGS